MGATGSAVIVVLRLCGEPRLPFDAAWTEFLSLPQRGQDLDTVFFEQPNRMIGELRLPQPRIAHVLLAVHPGVVRALILQKKLIQGLVASGVIFEGLLKGREIGRASCRERV